MTYGACGSTGVDAHWALHLKHDLGSQTGRVMASSQRHDQTPKLLLSAASACCLYNSTELFSQTSVVKTHPDLVVIGTLYTIPYNIMSF